jgi:hypothetical protein
VCVRVYVFVCVCVRESVCLQSFGEHLYVEVCISHVTVSVRVRERVCGGLCGCMCMCVYMCVYMCVHVCGMCVHVGWI